MCHSIKVIAKNCCGQLAFCLTCRKYHLDFNNICVELCENEMIAFRTFVQGIDVDYWESKYGCKVIRRKIPIPTLQKNLILIFNKQELSLLKDLIHENTKLSNDMLAIEDIDYTFILN